MVRDIDFALELGQRTKYLMDLQSERGVYFDKEEAESLHSDIVKMMDDIEAELKDILPHVDTPKADRIGFPKRRFKQEKGQVVPSSYVEKWSVDYDFPLVNDNGEWYIEINAVKLPLASIDEHFCLNPTRPLNLWSNPDQAQLKQMIMAEGWRPTYWNFKTGPDGKKIRDKNNNDYIKTSPKWQEQGNLCPNLEAMGEEYEYIAKVVKWVQLKHRRGVLRTKNDDGGWLNDERVLRDGRISARSSGLAHTRRQKHTGVANVPRPTTFMGDRLRACLRASPGMVAVGYDASALEAMLKAHYAYEFDGGEYARKVMAPGYDEHVENATIWGLIEQYGPDTGRRKAKPGGYALQYNCGPPTLAEQLGCSVEEAELHWEAYWEANWGWQRYCKKLEEMYYSVGRKKYIKCPVSGQTLQVRTKHSLGSTQVQHTGAFVLDYAGCIMDHWLGGIKFNDAGLPCYYLDGYECARVIYYHDEYMWEAEEEIAEKLLTIGKESIRLAGKRLGLKVPLDADGKIGQHWGAVHG